MRELEVKVRVDLSQAWAGLLDVYRSCLRCFPLTAGQRVKLQREVRRIERRARRSKAAAA